jgi:hypothetical protein
VLEAVARHHDLPGLGGHVAHGGHLVVHALHQHGDHLQTTHTHTHARTVGDEHGRGGSSGCVSRTVSMRPENLAPKACQTSSRGQKAGGPRARFERRCASPPGDRQRDPCSPRARMCSGAGSPRRCRAAPRAGGRYLRSERSAASATPRALLSAPCCRSTWLRPCAAPERCTLLVSPCAPAYQRRRRAARARARCALRSSSSQSMRPSWCDSPTPTAPRVAAGRQARETGTRKSEASAGGRGGTYPGRSRRASEPPRCGLRGWGQRVRPARVARACERVGGRRAEPSRAGPAHLEVLEQRLVVGKDVVDVAGERAHAAHDLRRHLLDGGLAVLESVAQDGHDERQRRRVHRVHEACVDQRLQRTCAHRRARAPSAVAQQAQRREHSRFVCSAGSASACSRTLP